MTAVRKRLTVESFTIQTNSMEVHTPFSLPGSSALDPKHFSPSGGNLPPLTTPPNLPVPRRRSKRWIPITIIVILLGLLGGGYFAYSKGYIAIPFLSPDPEALIAKTAATFEGMKSGQYTAKILVAVEPREAGATSLLVNVDATTNTAPTGELDSIIGGFGGVDDLLEDAPSDLSLDTTLTVAYENGPMEQTNGRVVLNGTYRGDSATTAFGLEVRKKAEQMFLMITDLPKILLFDFPALKDKWIAFNPDDVSWYSEQTLNEIEQNADALDLATIVSRAYRQGFVTVAETLSSESVAGATAQHLRLAFHPDKLPDLYRGLIADAKAKNVNTTSLDEGLADAATPATQQQLQRIVDNSRFDVWIDRDGILRQAEWGLRVIPADGSDELIDKQLGVTMRLTVDSINQAVTVDAPTPTIDSDEATRLLTGMTKEEQDYYNQTSAVRLLQMALVQYHSAYERYPETLEALGQGLKQAADACQKREADRLNTNGLGLGEGCIALQVSANQKLTLNDVYTDQPFAYTSTETNYELQYTIQYYEGMSDLDKKEVVEGKNTATSTAFSAEADAAAPPASTNTNSTTNQNTNSTVNTNTSLFSGEDADDDGLPDVWEPLYGTNPEVADTDGDGYSDGTEVENGYNPNGEGKL